MTLDQYLAKTGVKLGENARPLCGPLGEKIRELECQDPSESNIALREAKEQRKQLLAQLRKWQARRA
ncbi:hypothetical protein FRC09_000586, partial [Ceratobasidium sp. 395]